MTGLSIKNAEKLAALVAAVAMTCASNVALAKSKSKAGCLPEVSAEFSLDGMTTTVKSSKDLSNVVLLYSDGTVQKYDDLKGHEATFIGLGDDDKILSGVWIKSGCNHSGDGPGYGEFVANDDTVTYVPVVSIGDNPLIFEDAFMDVEAQFLVTLSERVPEGAIVKVDFMTFDGTAYAGEDYVFQTGTIEFLPGEISKTVSVTVIGDELYELDEFFHVDLMSPLNATIGKERGTGTIYDYGDDF